MNGVVTHASLRKRGAAGPDHVGTTRRGGDPGGPAQRRVTTQSGQLSILPIRTRDMLKEGIIVILCAGVHPATQGQDAASASSRESPGIATERRHPVPSSYSFVHARSGRITSSPGRGRSNEECQRQEDGSSFLDSLVRASRTEGSVDPDATPRRDDTCRARAPRHGARTAPSRSNQGGDAAVIPGPTPPHCSHRLDPREPRDRSRPRETGGGFMYRTTRENHA